MPEHPTPVYRTMDTLHLIGTMAIYESQAEASAGIPLQWTEFLRRHPALAHRNLLGASPCTADRRIHYLTGVAQQDWVGSIDGEPLLLEAGEYAVVPVNDAALLRYTWIWLLGSWLSASGRREKKAPEFEKYTAISESGFPVGPVEIWIPLEAPSTE